MKSTQSPFMIKIFCDDQPTKIRFNRKQSLQMERGSHESIDKQGRDKYFSSYPTFQATKSKIVSPPVGQQNCEDYEMDRKKSAFLKNYNEKLKRERKRQLRLKSSIKQLKTTKYFTNQSRSISYSDQTVTQSYTRTTKSQQQNEQDKSSPSILVLRKSPFLDTSASIFRSAKDYSKDSTIQLLLKEINEIKMEQKKEMEKVNREKKFFEQYSSKEIINKTKEHFFTKYDYGFLLPTKKKIVLNTGTMTRASEMVLEGLQNSLMKYSSREKVKGYKKTSDRGHLDNFYNFKHIDPWDNSTQREQNQSFDNHFLFSTMQN